MSKSFRLSTLLLLVLGLFLSPLRPSVSASLDYVTDSEQNLPDSGLTRQFNQLVDQWTKPVLPADSIPELPQANPDNVIYLTFDDGPDPKWTPQILELLQSYHATATFYMIGRNARSFSETVLQVAQAGQMIGLHGYNHIDLTKLSYADFYLEIVDTEIAIRDALAANPELENQVTPCLRPPYGAVNDTVYSTAFGMNYAISLWQLDTLDWTNPTAEEIFGTVMKNLQPYKVVLMHDGGENRTVTVRALGLILHELTLRGYTFQPYCTANGQELNR
ncbi:MAG: polysaccharide deacetylase family protein [Anaerolineaceae bacterium]